jgi:hypothetical protein
MSGAQIAQAQKLDKADARYFAHPPEVTGDQHRLSGEEPV